MKKIFWHLARAVGLSICLSVSLIAQNINRLEYYIDADPGFGNGTAVTFTAASTINEAFNIPLSSVGDGFHFVGIRAKNDANKWSTVVMRPFFKERIVGAASPFGLVTAMEYFIDNDPGFGSGTPVSFTPATTTTDFVFVAPLTTVSNGMHWLSVRAKDNANKWTTVVVRPFLKENIPLAAPLANITNIEYFVDIDPGFGNGTAVTFTPNTTLSNVAITANLNGLSYGLHRLFIRVKDANNKWTTVGMKEFNNCLLPVNASITAGGATTFCSGQNVVLSVPAGNTYQWYRDGNILSGSTSSTYTASSSGSYTAVVSSAGCSITTNPVVVTVNSASAPSVSTTTATICNGQQAILTASGCDGGTVTWSNGSTSNPQFFSPNATATYTATCTKPGCASPSGASSAVTVTVNNTPAPMTISGVPASPVCPGTTVLLTASSCSGVRTWSTGITGGTITVTPSQSTSYTLTCTSGTCKSQTTATVNIVTPSPTSMTVDTPNQTVCAGTSVTLTASNCVGGSIAWSNGVTASSTTVTPTQTTTYTASCTIGSCTNNGQNAVQIVVLNPPNPPVNTMTSQTICRGGSVTLFATNCGNDLVWSNGMIGNNITFTPTATATYTAVCRFEECSSTASGAATITVSDCADPSVNITRIEYFIDNDPGFGNGTIVTGYSSAPAVNNFTFTAPISAVSTGLHWLSVRAKDGNNKWTTVIVRPFSKEVIPASVLLPNLTKVEYFFDNDPGFGLATDVPITAGTAINDLIFTTALPNAMTNGIHRLSVRVKDANNKWSTVVNRVFLKEAVPITSSLPNIVAMEYFINTDPGVGLGTAIPVTAGTNLTNVLASVTLEDLNLGLNRLFVRAKDANNVWGVVGQVDFNIQDEIIQIGTAPATACKTVPFNMPFTLVGTYNAGNVFTAQLSNSSGSFSSPTNIGTLTSIANGTIATTIPNSITSGSGYKVRIISSNPAKISDAKPITINAIATTPLIQSSDKDNIICGNESVTLAVTNCSGSISWSNGATTSTITVSTAGSYTAICTENSCASATSAPQVVVVNPIPPTPNVTSNDADNIVCAGTNVVLSVSNCTNGTVTWSNNATGTSLTVSSSGIYSAICNINGCNSISSALQTVVVNPNPPTPIVQSNSATNIVCAGTNVILSISNCNGTVNWSNNATGNSLTVSSSGTYTAICSANGCNSPSSSLQTVVINPIPPTPNVTSNDADNIVCVGTNVVLSVNNCTNGTVTWSNNATGASVTVSSSGTYSATCSINGCTSPSSALQNVVVNPIPAIPIVQSDDADNTICNGGTVTLSVSNCVGIVTWSNNATGNTLAVTTSGTFTAACTVNGCLSANSIPQTITLTGVCPLIMTPVRAYKCPNTSVILSASGCPNTITWTGGGTGTSITVNPSITTTYTASCAGGGTGSVVVTVAITTATLTSVDNITTGTAQFQVTEFLNSTSQVGSPAVNPKPNVTYRAGKSISLNPGFSVEPGTIFKTEIQGCI
jgi:hypothetical protein